jgi:NAD-dependent dihydropyrimidine dehydrogenase PreA subunit
MRSDATFIGVEVDDAVAAEIAVAAKLTEVCPVDIYAQDAAGVLEIVVDNLDECVLCGLCLDAAPDGTVRVLKLYDDEALLQR